MTPPKIDLARLLRDAKSNQPTPDGRCPVCGFDLAYRHRYGCTVNEKPWREIASPEVIVSLVEALSEAREALEFIASGFATEGDCQTCDFGPVQEEEHHPNCVFNVAVQALRKIKERVGE